jgi:hypothetical protein
VNVTDPLGLWGWNPISDVTQAAGDVGHYVAKHKAAIIEIAVGVTIVAGIVIATVATGGIADFVAAGAAAAAEEAAAAEASGDLVGGLLAANFPGDVITGLAPLGLTGVVGLGLIGYGTYSLFAGTSSGTKGTCSQ